MGGACSVKRNEHISDGVCQGRLWPVPRSQFGATISSQDATCTAMSDSRHVMKATLDVLAAVEEAKKVGGAPERPPESQDFPYQPVPDGQVKTLSAPEIATALDAMGAPPLPAIKLRVKNEKGQMVEGTALSISMQLNGTGRRLKCVEEAIRANIDPSEWPKIGMYHRTNGNLVAILTMLTKAITATNKSVRTPVLKELQDEVASLRKQLAASQAPYTPVFAQEQYPVDGMRDVTVSKLFRPNDQVSVKVNPKSDAGIYYRSRTAMQKAVKNEDVIVQATQDLKWFIANLLAQKNNYSAALKAMYNADPMRFIVMMKAKNEMMKVSNWLVKQRIINVFPCWEALLGQTVLLRTWKRVKNFIQDPSSNFMHNAGWHNGNARLFIQRILNLGEGLWCVNAGDDTLCVFVQLDVILHGGGYSYVTLDGEPIVLERPWACEIPQNVRKRIVVAAPDAERFDLRLLSAVWGFAVNRDVRALAVNPSSLMEFLMKFMAFRVFNADCLFHRSIIARLVNVLKAGHSATTCFNTCAMRDLNATHRVAWEISDHLTFAPPPVVSEASSPAPTPNGEPAVESELVERKVVTKFGDVATIRTDTNFNPGVVTDVAGYVDYKKNAKAADEARANPKPLVYSANRFTARGLRPPEGDMAGHPDFRFSSPFVVRPAARTLDVSLVEQFLKRRAAVISAIGMAYKPETLVAEEFDQLKPKISIPFLGHTIEPHTFHIGSQTVESYIAKYSEPMKSLASLLNAPIKSGEDAGPPILAVLMSQAVCIALGNSTDARVYAVCKQVFEHGAKAGNYPVVSEDYLDGYALTDDIDIDELLRLPKDVKLPSFPEMQRLQLFSEDRVLRSALGPMYFNVHGYAPPPKPGQMVQEVADVNPFSALDDGFMLPATTGGAAGLIQANIDRTDAKHFGQLVETEEHKLKRKETLRQHAFNKAAAEERAERRRARNYGRDSPRDDDTQSVAETEYAIDEDVADLKEERRRAREDLVQDLEDEAHQRARESDHGDEDMQSEAGTEYNADDVFDMRGGGDRISQMSEDEYRTFLLEQLDDDEPSVLPARAPTLAPPGGAYLAPSAYQIALAVAEEGDSSDGEPVDDPAPPPPSPQHFAGISRQLDEDLADTVQAVYDRTWGMRVTRDEWIDRLRARELRHIGLGLPEVHDRPPYPLTEIVGLSPRGHPVAVSVDVPSRFVGGVPVVEAAEVKRQGPGYCWTCESVSCFCGKAATSFYYAQHLIPTMDVPAPEDVKMELEVDELFDVHAVMRGDTFGPLKRDDAYVAAAWVHGQGQIERAKQRHKAVVAELNKRRDFEQAVSVALAVENEYCGGCGNLACTCVDAHDRDSPLFNVGDDGDEPTYNCAFETDDHQGQLGADIGVCYECNVDKTFGKQFEPGSSQLARCSICSHCLCSHCHTKHLRYCPPLKVLAVEESKRLRERLAAIDRNFSKKFWRHYSRLTSRSRAAVLYASNNLEGRETLREVWCVCAFCDTPLFPNVDHANSCSDYRRIRTSELHDARRAARLDADVRVNEFIDLHTKCAPGAVGLPRKKLTCVFMAPPIDKKKLEKRKIRNAKRNAKRKEKRRVERECVQKSAVAGMPAGPGVRMDVGHGDYKSVIGTAIGAAAPYLRKGARWLIDKGAKWLHGLVGEGDYQWKDMNIAQNSLWAKSTGPAVVLSSPDNPNVMRGREKLLNVFSSNAFRHTEVSINPGTSFPWLPPVASAFQRYIVRGMIFEYVKAINSVSTGNVDGRVVLGARYDLNIAAPVNIDQAEEADWAVPLDPMRPGIMGVECAPKYRPVNVLNIRLSDLPDGADAQFFDFIKFDLCQEGQTGVANTLIGEVWCSYEIELVNRIADNAGTKTGNSALWRSTTATQDTKPYLTSATFEKLHNDDFKFTNVADNKVQVEVPADDPPGSRYSVQHIQESSGATITGVTVARAYTNLTTNGAQFFKYSNGSIGNEIFTGGTNTAVANSSATNVDIVLVKTSAKGVGASFTLEFTVSSSAATTTGRTTLLISYLNIGISVDERMRARFPQLYDEAERRLSERLRIENLERTVASLTERSVLSGAIPPPRSEAGDDVQSVDMCN